MRIIGFSNVAAPSSFWTLPVQALGPWMSRVKLSVGHLLKQAAQGDSEARMQIQARSCVATGAWAASNEAVFALPEMAEMPVRPGNAVKAGARAAPLRVVRESDAALGAEYAGRMVISGRMADVCAELERMALQADAAQAAGVPIQP